MHSYALCKDLKIMKYNLTIIVITSKQVFKSFVIAKCQYSSSESKTVGHVGA